MVTCKQVTTVLFEPRMSVPTISTYCIVSVSNVKELKLSEEDAQRLRLFQEYDWNIHREHFFLSLRLEKNDGDEYIFRQIDWAIRNKITTAAFHEIIDLMTEHYKLKKENRWESKVRQILEAVGVPRGGMRYIRCPQCKRAMFHCRVMCPVCAKENREQQVITGCRDQYCPANAAHMAELKKAKTPLEELALRTCNGLDRRSDTEVITATPLDFLCSAYYNGVQDKMTLSSPQELLKRVQEAIREDSFFYGCSAGIAYIYNKMGEQRLYEAVKDYFQDSTISDQDMEGMILKTIQRSFSKSSPESVLFNLSTVSY